MSSNADEQRVLDMWAAMSDEAQKSLGVVRLEGDELSVMRACASVALRLLKPKTVTWMAVDDWHAIYVDGQLIGEQGHSLSPWTWMDVLRYLGCEVEDLRYSDIAERCAEEEGRFPDEWPPNSPSPKMQRS